MWPIPPTLQISRIDHVGRVYALDIGVADIELHLRRVYALDIGVADIELHLRGVYALDIGVADIELHLRTIPSTSPRPLGFVDAFVAIDTPDPPRTNRYMLQIPGNSRPSARSICRELVDTVARVYTPDLGVAHIDLHEATTDPGPPAGAGPLAFVDVVVAIDTPDPPRTNRYMLQPPGNSRPSARSICRALPDPMAPVYTPDVGVANIELHEVRCKLVLATLVRAIALTSHIGLHHRLHLCSSRGQCNEQQDKCSEVSTALMAV